MKNLLLTLIFFATVSCFENNAPKENSVYFWKTVFKTDSTENDFLKKHKISKIYMRYFDVIVDPKTQKPKPNATISFKDTLPKNIEIIPTVFITENCIQKNLDTLYKTLADRILQINKTHKISQAKEIQIDCDFTAKSMKKYYNFLSLLKNYLKEKDIKLSVTIRLHQLSMEIPPCDYGVLMLYNTGNYRDKKCENPILSFKDVKPYLKHLKKYRLELKAALPNFKWQILFGKNGFKNIVYNQDLSDSTLFQQVSEGVFRIVRSKDIPVYINTEAFNVMMNFSDTIFETKAEFKEIEKVMTEISQIRKDVLTNTIVYDLNSNNINNLTFKEYEKIFNFNDSVAAF
ncbi:MAG: hypothetical protein II956_10525 [Bacteroidales bacterium]|nr:hypothetical protein [Bacteroidales bacterium]